MYTERLQCDKDLALKLAALALQEIRGDYTTDESALKILQKHNLLAPGTPPNSYQEVITGNFITHVKCIPSKEMFLVGIYFGGEKKVLQIFLFISSVV